jgi:hypothetical protein
LCAIRQHAAAELARLPEHLHQLQVDHPYALSTAQAVNGLADAVGRRTLSPLSR